MKANEKSESSFQKIFVGVAIAVIPVIIFYYFGINTTPSSPQQYYPSVEPITDLNYTQFIGIYKGITVNTVSYSKGNTIFDIKEIDNVTKKVKVEVAWYNGLSGQGKLFGEVHEYVVDLQGSIYSEFTGNWDIEMTINLDPNSSNIEGVYKIHPWPGNPNGTQNGTFELVKYELD